MRFGTREISEREERSLVFSCVLYDGESLQRREKRGVLCSLVFSLLVRAFYCSALCRKGRIDGVT